MGLVLILDSSFLFSDLKLKELGCPKINLQVRDDNTEVIEFYKSIGYHDDKVLSLGKRLIPDEEYDIKIDRSKD